MESGEEDSLIMSTYRASKLEEENRQLKVRLENRGISAIHALFFFPRRY